MSSHARHRRETAPPALAPLGLLAIGENILIVAWVQHSLTERCAGYRFTLGHLAVAEPESEAADVDRVLTRLQQQIAANSLVPAPHFAGMPVAVAAGRASVPR